MENNELKTYRTRTWNENDIPTPDDLQNIENGIKNNNSMILQLNREITTFESTSNNKMNLEVNKLNTLKTNIDNDELNLNSHRSTVNTFSSAIHQAKTIISIYESDFNLGLRFGKRYLAGFATFPKPVLSEPIRSIVPLSFRPFTASMLIPKLAAISFAVMRGLDLIKENTVSFTVSTTGVTVSFRVSLIPMSGSRF